MSHSTESIKFKAHQALIKQIIYKQHGEHFKAILELIQNTEDAEASEILLRFTNRDFLVQDNGKGFPNKKYIEEYFATFGTPHVKGDSKFGRFRIGRGQIMSMSNVTWRSKLWEMNVNISSEDDEPAFNLTTYKDNINGCIIKGEWFEEMDQFVFTQQHQKLLKSIKYFSTPILDENGNQINISPESQEWDYENEDFYYKKDDSQRLDVYNLGAFVGSLNSYDSDGISGILVSKVHLNLNTARNSILSSCQIWARIKEKLRENFSKNKTKNPFAYLSDNERVGILLSWLGGRYKDLPLNNIALIKDVKGKHITFKGLINKKLCIVEKGKYNDFIIDRVYQSNKSNVIFIEDSYLSNFQIENIKTLINSIKSSAMYYSKGIDYRDENRNILTLLSSFNALEIEFKVLAKSYEGDSNIIKESELKTPELLMFKAFKSILNSPNFKKRYFNALVDTSSWYHLVENSGWARSAPEEFALGLHMGSSFTRYSRNLSDNSKEEIMETTEGLFKSIQRILKVGLSNSADAWTDGSTYIALNQELLKLHTKEYEGFHKLSMIIAHELCHNSSNLKTHVHELEFYETFHNLTIGDKYGNSAIMFLAQQSYKKWVNDMEKETGKELSNKHYNSLECRSRKSKIPNKGKIKISVNGQDLFLTGVGKNEVILKISKKEEIEIFKKAFPYFKIENFLKDRELLQRIMYEKYLEENGSNGEYNYKARYVESSFVDYRSTREDLLFIRKDIVDVPKQAFGSKTKAKETTEILNSRLYELELGKIIKILEEKVSLIIDEDAYISKIDLGRTKMLSWKGAK